MIWALDDESPTLGEGVWVAPDAQVIGRVILGREASIWYGAVLRGDSEQITVGDGTNVQDLSCLHVDTGYPLVIGNDCTIGHRAMIHGCTIGDGALIGMGATVLNGAVVGAGALIGAGSLITEGTQIPPGALVVGAPGRVVRTLDEAAITRMRAGATHYRQNAARHRAGLRRIDG